MGLLSKLFGQRRKPVPDKARLRRIKVELEECIHILTNSEARDEVATALQQVSNILKESSVMPPEVKAIGISAGVLSPLTEAGSEENIPKNRDIYARKFREFVAQIDEILSE